MIRRPISIRTAVATILATLAVGAGAGAVVYSVLASPDTVVRQVPVQSSEPATSTSALTVGEIYRRAHRGVVEITVTSEAQPTPFGNQQQRGQGSGFVYDTEGHVITNEHVVDDAESVSVRFWNGAVYKARVVGSDKSTDLAVLDVDAPQSILHPLSLGDSSKVQVGDGVVAIGSPFGLEETVTSGIVSALHRQMDARNGFAINDSIQTDAAINHGNSGGPLIDAQGRVIGVNAQIRSESGGNDGVGFAIPSNTVRSIASQLIESGKVEHAYLGVSVQTIPGTVASELDLVEGVAVREVRPGTPAKKAGLRAAIESRVVDGVEYPADGDVITAVDGEKVTSSEDLQRAIDAKNPGDTISIEYWRNGDSHTVEVKLATRPS